MSSAETEDRLPEYIEAGSDIAGSTVGAAIGLFGGPAGALAGAALGPIAVRVLRFVGKDFSTRILGPREDQRVGATLVFAEKALEQLVAEGHTIRTDGFFSDSPDAPAAEITEGILLAAQRDHQNKKARLYGNLLASVAVTPEIDVDYANYVVRSTQKLSYRQLCLLAIIARPGNFALRTRRFPPTPTQNHVGILSELDEIGYGNLELIVPKPHEGGGMPENIGSPGASILSHEGEVLVSLLRLDTIDQSDLQTVAELLS